MFLTSLRQALRPGLSRPAEAALSVRVRGGYAPDVLYAPAGVPLRIGFLREESAPGSERVVFPEFGKSAMLPRGELVTVELPAAQPGRYEFTCALNVLHGTLVVESEETR